MLKAICFLLSSLLISPSLYASWTTVYCQTPGYLGLKIVNFPKGKALSCSDVDQTFVDVLSQLQNLSPVELSGPLTVVYNVFLTQGGLYDWSTSTIDVGIPDISKTQSTLALFQHEMGHRIYANIRDQVLVDFAELHAVVKNYSDYAVACLMKENPAKSCATDTAPLMIKQAASEAPNHVHAFLDHNVAYEELFSDVVAALASEDLDVNVKAITEMASAEQALGRGFSVNVLDDSQGQNPYRRFGSLRKDIWEKWITPRLSDKKALLRDLAMIMIVESAMNFSGDSALTPEARAKLQIKRLRQQLKI